ncbi:MAG: ABC transporter substrate-binding protein, partial [Desulfomicrobium sp.]|nr:ABC transporter substrate-binding protein [Desulfomicrobium sp.]
MKRFVMTALLVMAMACPGFAKTYNVSVNQFVEHPSLDAVLKGFKDSLKAEGVEVKYSVHNAQANMATCNQIAARIAGENPDLVLAIATPSAQASAVATKKSPILAGSPLLFTAITDPVGAGLVDNLEKPGKNITGVSDMLPVAQHMAMLRRFYPELKKLGVIYNAGEANSRT